MQEVFQATVLKKYQVAYYYCEESGLLQTEKPYWLEEAYQQAIIDTDTGLVSRNLINSNWLETILEIFSLANGKVLDVAGGYGLLTRLLRDKGFDCYTTDKYCQNLFAKRFEPDATFKADALFAFEVLEHIENPLEFLQEIFDKYHCKTLFFTTTTFERDIPQKNWWYYALEGGQHITFYQPRTLSLLATLLKCNYYMINPSYHIITDKHLSRVTCLTIFNKYLRFLYTLYVHRKRRGLSRTWEDHLAMQALMQKG